MGIELRQIVAIISDRFVMCATLGEECRVVWTTGSKESLLLLSVPVRSLMREQRRQCHVKVTPWEPSTFVELLP